MDATLRMIEDECRIEDEYDRHVGSGHDQESLNLQAELAERILEAEQNRSQRPEIVLNERQARRVLGSLLRAS